MRGNRYDRGWTPGRGYGRDFGGRQGPRGAAADAGNQRGYDAGMRGRIRPRVDGDDGVRPRAGDGMNGGPGMFTPFGWDPMLRWSGWDPMMGFVPYQDAPREWSYGLAEDARRYEHDYYRGNVAHRYGGDYGRRPAQETHRLPPRQSPLYGQGGDRAVREWAREHGYDVGYTIQPRLGPRR